MGKTTLILTSLVLLAGISSALSPKRDLGISLKERRIRDLSSSGLTLAFHLEISNSSSRTYHLVRYDFRSVVNQAEYLRLETSPEEPIKIGPGETLIALPLKITYSLIFQDEEEVDKQEKVFCYIVGGLVFADERNREERLPFSVSGEFPVFKDPEIVFLPLQVRDLTLGGADLSFEVTFRNKNNFDLLVDKIHFRLEFGGRLIGEGAIKGDKNIQSRGEKAFSLPFLLDFFEIGREIHNILQQPLFTCRFSGEIEVMTIWGRLRIPFDKSDSISVAGSN